MACDDLKEKILREIKDSNGRSLAELQETYDAAVSASGEASQAAQDALDLVEDLVETAAGNQLLGQVLSGAFKVGTAAGQTASDVIMQSIDAIVAQGTTTAAGFLCDASGDPAAAPNANLVTARFACSHVAFVFVEGDAQNRTPQYELTVAFKNIDDTDATTDIPVAGLGVQIKRYENDPALVRKGRKSARIKESSFKITDQWHAAESCVAGHQRRGLP